jgi:hypothetical protein
VRTTVVANGCTLVSTRSSWIRSEPRRATNTSIVVGFAEEHLGHAAHVPRRDAAHVRLRDRVVDLGAAARVAPERRSRGSASTRAAHPDLDLARGGDHASVVPAVADVDPLVAALVGPGADQTLEFLVEHDLDGRLDRLPHAGGEVMLEVFLRRQHEVGR